MGVRISIYAVDELGFASWLNQPISELLNYYAENGLDSLRNLHFIDSERNLYFHSSPKRKVTVHGNETSLSQLSERDLYSDPFLARTAGELLQKDSSIALEMFMGCLSSCPAIECIREVTTGFRRWWIGSLLERAEQSKTLSKADYQEITFLLQKLLGPYECGKNIQRRDWKLCKNDFIIIPECAEGMCVWTAVEASRLLALLRELLAKDKPHFVAPSGAIGICPEKEEDWDEWVHSSLQQLFQIGEFHSEHMKVVGFIS